jgi:hypothetical protein
MVSQLGDRMAYISIPLFIASLQGTSLQLGIAYALENAPVLIIGWWVASSSTACGCGG